MTGDGERLAPVRLLESDAMSAADGDLCFRAMVYLDGARQEPVARPDRVITELGGVLVASYVAELNGTFEYVGRDDLRAAGMTQEQLHARALSNLSARAWQRLEVRRYGSVYMAIMDDCFEASLLLVDELWTDWYVELAPNGFLAACPARDILAFADSGDPRGLQTLQSLATGLSDTLDHPLPPYVYRRIGDRWEPIPLS